MTVAEDRCTFVAGEHQLDGDDAGAWIGFQRAHRELTRRLEHTLVERHGLSLSALELLGRVADQEDRMRRLSRLADDIGLSLSRVSRIMDALEKRGLVERRPCPSDTRAVNAWLTDTGLELVRTAQHDHVADVRETFLERLTPAERETLAAAFAKLTP